MVCQQKPNNKDSLNPNYIDGIYKTQVFTSDELPYV